MVETCVMNVVDEAVIVIENQGLAMHTCDPRPQEGGKLKTGLG